MELLNVDLDRTETVRYNMSELFYLLLYFEVLKEAIPENIL